MAEPAAITPMPVTIGPGLADNLFRTETYDLAFQLPSRDSPGNKQAVCQSLQAINGFEARPALICSGSGWPHRYNAGLRAHRPHQLLIRALSVSGGGKLVCGSSHIVQFMPGQSVSSGRPRSLKMSGVRLLAPSTAPSCQIAIPHTA